MNILFVAASNDKKKIEGFLLKYINYFTSGILMRGKCNYPYVLLGMFTISKHSRNYHHPCSSKSMPEYTNYWFFSSFRKLCNFKNHVIERIVFEVVLQILSYKINDSHTTWDYHYTVAWLRNRLSLSRFIPMSFPVWEDSECLTTQTEANIFLFSVLGSTDPNLGWNPIKINIPNSGFIFISSTSSLLMVIDKKKQPNVNKLREHCKIVSPVCNLCKKLWP